SKASHAWPTGWVHDVHFTITDQGSILPREVRAEVVRQHDEQILVEQYLVRHAVTAEFRLPPLPHGRYRLTTSYDGLSQSTPGSMIVVRGDETPEIRDWTLRRQIEKTRTRSWENIKRLLLERTENLPHNPEPWFEL